MNKHLYAFKEAFNRSHDTRMVCRILGALAVIIFSAFILVACTGCISTKPKKDGCKETWRMSGYGGLKNHKALK